jgi:hypothetical protein
MPLLKELDSPFTHVFGTNYVPNDTETHRIGNSLSWHLNQISKLIVEIDPSACMQQISKLMS